MIEIYDMRTENLTEPLGVDALRPRFSWKLKSDEQEIVQESYRIRVYDKTKVLWDSKQIFSAESRHIRYGGEPLQSRQELAWKVELTVRGGSGKRTSVSGGEAHFEMGLLSRRDWKGIWIEPEGEINPDARKEVPYLRRIVTVKKGLKNARIYQTAHGLYEAWINGRLCTEDKFKPGLTSYYYRIQYQSYDITRLLQEGENIWAVMLGDGWWRGVTGGSVKNNFGYKLHFLGQIELSYQDGTKEIIGSDEEFRCSHGGLIASDMMMGDIYDARLEPKGWKFPGFDDAEWKAVHAIEDSWGAERIASRSVPVREKERFAAKVMPDSAGRRVLDFGQNIAGYVKMHFRNTKAGQVIRLVHGETLNSKGLFTIANVDKTSLPVEAFQEVTYLCKGEAVEEYQPMFSIFGFRYVLLEGYDGEIREGDFEATAVYSDMAETGFFTCSNPLINKLVDNSRWSQKGNFMDVPVDCPTRERNPWTGDAQIYASTASYFMDVYSFYEKWLLDQKTEQYDSGKVGITFPSTSSVHNPDALSEMKRVNPIYEIAGPSGDGNIGEDSAGWGDAAVWIPYIIYQNYGDTTILENQYDTSKRWVEYELKCARDKNPAYENDSTKMYYQYSTDGHCDGEFIWDTKFHYGEWNEAIGISEERGDEEDTTLQFTERPSAEEAIQEKQEAAAKVAAFLQYMAKQGNAVVATAYLYRSVSNLSRMAGVLGKQEEAQHYGKIAARIRDCYDKYLISEDGVIEAGHQAPYVRALAFGLAGKGKREKVLAQLKKEIADNGYRLNTGFLSTPFLLPVLADAGETELAYRLLTNTKRPGWLYPITRGATTITESWDGIDTLKDSLNHYSYGAVCEFLFAYVGGIRPIWEKPGFQEFEIRPVVGGSLDFAEVVFESPYGRIKSRWEKTESQIEYFFEIPANTKAHVILEDGTEERFGSGEWKMRTEKCPA